MLGGSRGAAELCGGQQGLSEQGQCSDLRAELDFFVLRHAARPPVYSACIRQHINRAKHCLPYGVVLGYPTHFNFV